MKHRCTVAGTRHYLTSPKIHASVASSGHHPAAACATSAVDLESRDCTAQPSARTHQKRRGRNATARARRLHTHSPFQVSPAMPDTSQAYLRRDETTGPQSGIRRRTVDVRKWLSPRWSPLQASINERRRVRSSGRAVTDLSVRSYGMAPSTSSPRSGLLRDPNI